MQPKNRNPRFATSFPLRYRGHGLQNPSSGLRHGMPVASGGSSRKPHDAGVSSTNDYFVLRCCFPTYRMAAGVRAGLWVSGGRTRGNTEPWENKLLTVVPFSHPGTSCLCSADGSRPGYPSSGLEHSHLRKQDTSSSHGESTARSQRGIRLRCLAYPPPHKQGVSRWYAGAKCTDGHLYPQTWASPHTPLGTPFLKESTGMQASCHASLFLTYTTHWTGLGINTGAPKM